MTESTVPSPDQVAEKKRPPEADIMAARDFVQAWQQANTGVQLTEAVVDSLSNEAWKQLSKLQQDIVRHVVKKADQKRATQQMEQQIQQEAVQREHAQQDADAYIQANIQTFGAPTRITNNQAFRQLSPAAQQIVRDRYSNG